MPSLLRKSGHEPEAKPSALAKALDPLVHLPELALAHELQTARDPLARGHHRGAREAEAAHGREHDGAEQNVLADAHLLRRAARRLSVEVLPGRAALGRVFVLLRPVLDPVTRHVALPLVPAPLRDDGRLELLVANQVAAPFQVLDGARDVLQRLAVGRRRTPGPLLRCRRRAAPFPTNPLDHRRAASAVSVSGRVRATGAARLLTTRVSKESASLPAVRGCRRLLWLRVSVSGLLIASFLLRFLTVFYDDLSAADSNAVFLAYFVVVLVLSTHSVFVLVVRPLLSLPKLPS